MKENKNYPAHPTGGFTGYEPRSGLTKLELISAMCLQGILSYPFEQMNYFPTHSERIRYAIENAKELLKQLEAEND